MSSGTTGASTGTIAHEPQGCLYHLFCTEHSDSAQPPPPHYRFLTHSKSGATFGFDKSYGRAKYTVVSCDGNERNVGILSDPTSKGSPQYFSERIRLPLQLGNLCNFMVGNVKEDVRKMERNHTSVETYWQTDYTVGIKIRIGFNDGSIRQHVWWSIMKCDIKPSG